MTISLIETKTLSVAATSIEFTNIPQDGTDLLLLVSDRSGVNAVAENGRLAINNDTGTNYPGRFLYGTGTGVGSVSDTSPFITVAAGATSTANTFGNSRVYIPNYTGSQNKVAMGDGVSENNASSADQWLLCYRWTNTAAVTSLKYYYGSNSNLAVGSIISLYKITKA